MALFTQKPIDAIDASIERLEKLNKLNIKRKAKGFVSFSIGIGIHTGTQMLGIIVLLIAVFPATIYRLTSALDGSAELRVPLWALSLRLPIQFLLMYWAYSVAKQKDFAVSISKRK